MWGFFPCGSFSPLSILPLDFLSVSVFCHTLSPLLSCLCWVCHLQGVAGGAKWSCGRREMDLLRMDLLGVGVLGSDGQSCCCPAGPRGSLVPVPTLVAPALLCWQRGLRGAWLGLTVYPQKQTQR